MHVKAIHDNKCNLLCAMDINDSVGYIEKYFPETYFFTQFQRFDRYIDKISNSINKINYLTICTPNYLHDSHIKFGLRSKLNVICEKPLVISPWNLDRIEKMQKEYSKKVFSINQLRLHPAILKLKNNKKFLINNHDVEITYIAPRGNWYKFSWKGDHNKSGGILYNIGIHLFDLIIFLFGSIKQTTVHFSSSDCFAGVITTQKATIRYFLSIEKEHLKYFSNYPKNNIKLMKINNMKVDLSKNFENLHTISYKNILQNKGYKINDIREGIELIYKTKKPLFHL